MPIVRTPVPSIPTKLTEVEVGSAPRPGTPTVVLVTRGSDEDDPSPVRLTDGAGVPDAWLPAGLLRGQAGEVHQLRGGRWLLGVGDAADPPDWRTAGAAIVRAVDADIAARTEVGRRPRRTFQVEIPDGTPTECIAALVLGLRLGGYRFQVTAEPEKARTRSVLLIASPARGAEIASEVTRAADVAAATALARDLANTPSNVKNPAWLARTAQRVADGIAGLTVVIREPAWLLEHGFGGTLAVGGGSASSPRLIELRYRPRGARAKLLLVGKGITFDTGGISIKPAEGMHLMRTDMAGGGAVIAAMATIARRKPPVSVTALVPAAENHVSGSAYRPGDILRHYGGRTSEIGNTDAEGRLVLADAIAYGVNRFAPDAVVDVATLTGAMKVALGLRTGGLFATDDELAARLVECGERVGETWWRMPLLEAHEAAVRSEIADAKQAPDGPGGITAALFLREFTDGVPWAHLDIAGPARADKTHDEVTPGGTGFGARTLVELVDSYA